MYSLVADETYCKDSGHVIVAGFLITSDQFRNLTEAWRARLADAKLDYFHMKEGHHKSHPEAYAALADLITHDHITAGFCASVLRSEYRSICSCKINGQSLTYWIGGEYSFCVGAIAQLANQWLDANNPGERDMAYVFDAGNEREKEANDFLGRVGSDPLMIARKHLIRYYSHSFVDGKRKDGGPLQAADMLAWNLGYRQRPAKKWNSIGARIIDAVRVYSVHYGADGLRETVAGQEAFWEHYGSLKHAHVLNTKRR